MANDYHRIVGRAFLGECSERARRVFEYWDSKRGDRAMPSRADIDPSEIKDLLPGIVLVDVNYAPLRLTYRLVGTDEVEARGYDPTGKDVREHVFAVSPQEGFRTYQLVIEQRDVVYDQEPTTAANARLCEVGSVLMPLSNDGATVNMVMAFIDYRRQR